MKLNNARAIVWLFAMLPLLGLLMSLFGVNSTSFAQIPEPTPTPLPLPPLLPTPNQREGLQPVKHSLPNQHAVTINSTEGWVETPLMLQAGDEFTVSYISGSWSVDYNLLNYVGPEGYSPEIDSQIFPGCKIVSSLPYARLLGEVGAGSTFSVGSGGTFTANASGYLFLRINDMDSCLVDNDGAVVMEVNLITDTTPPTVNWIAPVGNQEVYYASSGIVNLEVSATDDTGVALVDFWRWDAVNGNWIYLSGDSAPPYQATVDISTLNMEWNQINAYAYDHANNWGTENIWVYRSLPVSANFDAWPQTGNAPLTVSFHIVSTENITDCLWNYGDGTTGTSCEAYHDHIYPNAGSYTVSLTVSGSGASDSMTRQNYITVSGVPDLRQNGEIVVSGDLHEGGTVYLTIPVKNFGSVASPAIHVYTEGYTANSVFWRAENSQPPSVFLVPGQIVEFTVQHELWDGDVGWWDISGGVHIWNDDTSSYYGPLDANGYEQKTIDFRVNAATPDAPILNNIANPDNNDDYTVSWSSVSNATSYTLQEKQGSGSWNTIYTGTNTSRNLTGKTNGTWCYRAQASNQAGTSPWSNVKCTTVLIIDIGFNRSSDGFKFPNYGDFQASDFTLDDMRDLFGDDAICYMIKGNCIIGLQARLWHEVAVRKLKGGKCDGLASTSLLLFKGLGAVDRNDPSDFQNGASVTFDVEKPNIRDYIAFNYLKQYVEPVSQVKENSRYFLPSEIFNQLSAAMRAGSDLPTIFIRQTGAGGHGLVPYKIDPQGNGVYWVHVYDNNHPYPEPDNRYVVIDTRNETWTYDHKNSIGVWSGNGGTDSMGIVPISNYAAQPECIWCVLPITSEQIASNSQTEIGLFGQAHLLITNNQGQRIGYVGDTFLNEIQGAYPAWLDGGLGVELEPIYHLSSGQIYSVLVDGQTVNSSDKVGVSQFGPGFAAVVDQISVSANTLDKVIIAPSNSITYQANQSQEINMRLALDAGGENYLFEITGTDLASSNEVVLEYNATGNVLSVNHADAISSSYSLQLTKLSSNGETVFVHDSITIGEGDSHVFDLDTWNDEEITICTDYGSNGSIDACTSLENQASTYVQIYLPIIITH